MSERLTIPKTYKLAIGGSFVRSESGRSYQVRSAQGNFLANAAKASRKDARDAVRAARAAQPSWAGATAYNRGQVLYRVAEVLEGRRAQFTSEIAQQQGVSARESATQVEAAIDLWVWYAGWCDKYAQVAGGLNPVAGPYFNLSAPEPTGVVAIIAPQHDALLGLVSTIAPALVSGNTVVAVASEQFPLSAVSLAEVLATSDLPGGVVNVLTGSPAEIAPWLADHSDVNALDLVGAVANVSGASESATADTRSNSNPEIDWVDLQIRAAEHLARVLPPGPVVASPARISAFTEIKTVWHPKGLR